MLAASLPAAEKRVKRPAFSPTTARGQGGGISGLGLKSIDLRVSQAPSRSGAARSASRRAVGRFMEAMRAIQMVLCVPSHIGCDFVDLQPQNHTCVVAVAVYSRGARPKALWEPSQKGCLALRPQAHHQYFRPASTSTA